MSDFVTRELPLVFLRQPTPSPIVSGGEAPTAPMRMDKNNFDVRTAAEYAKAYGVSAAWLLLGEDQSVAHLNKKQTLSKLTAMIASNGFMLFALL